MTSAKPAEEDVAGHKAAVHETGVYETAVYETGVYETGEYDTAPDDEPLPAAGYRTYEVYQRERVGETTNLLTPRELIGDEMCTDPLRLLTILRENYPCYRDWRSNCFWLTRYDDVTSIFVDEANYESRSKRWVYGSPDFGRDLGDQVALQAAITACVDEATDGVVERAIAQLGPNPNLATAFAARLPLDLWGEVLNIEGDELRLFASRYWRAQQGASWHPHDRSDGLAALNELATWFDERLLAGNNSAFVATAAQLQLPHGVVTGLDLAATVLEHDHETLHGGLANLLFLLLTHPDQLQLVLDEPRLVKFAWLEALRHSPPVTAAHRFARHEVERFGRLVPDGGLLMCSALAANRDPRAFEEPDAFRVDRKDLCQREPRGQYRADGLPSGIAFGLGKPSIHPAEPKTRPRSRYALVRDVAVAAISRLLEARPDMALVDGPAPKLQSLRLGDMRTCWELAIR